MIRVGRIILDDTKVTKVIRESKKAATRYGKPSVKVTVHMDNGSSSTFSKHAEAVWNYFKDNVEATVGGDE